MKVRDLIERLQALPPEHEVVLAKDREGNGFSPLDEIDEGHYRAETTWHGELVRPDDLEEGDDPAPPNALVLWPVN